VSTINQKISEKTTNGKGEKRKVVKGKSAEESQPGKVVERNNTARRNCGPKQVQSVGGGSVAEEAHTSSRKASDEFGGK